MKQYFPLSITLIFLISCTQNTKSTGSISFESEIDTTYGFIGDVFQYNIHIQGLKDQTLSLPDLVIPEGEVKNIHEKSDGSVIHGVEFEIVYWDTGQQIIPSFTLDVLNPDSSVAMSFKSDPVFLTIQSVLDPNASSGLKPIKPPVPIDLPFPYREVILATILTGIIIGLILVWRKRIRAEYSKVHDIRTFQDPDEVAIQRLLALRKSSLMDSKTVYTEISHILREYVENSLFIRTLEMTTEEIEQSTNLFPVSSREFMSLVDVLKRSDLTKYARHIPTLLSIQDDIEWALGFVKNTTHLWKDSSDDVETLSHLN